MDALLTHGDFGRYFADDVVWTTMETGEQITGRATVADYIIRFHSEIFDARPELRRLITSDDVAVAEAYFVGTHQADFAGVPATGRSVTFPYCMVYDVTGGQISALRAYLPIAQLIQQLTQQG